MFAAEIRKTCDLQLQVQFKLAVASGRSFLENQRGGGRNTLCGLSITWCLIPGFDGAICSLEWKKALWDRYSD
jgi:hypothetical protein